MLVPRSCPGSRSQTNTIMSALEEKDWPGSPEEAGRPDVGTPVPMKMQLFSTWEVRKVPANCVSRYTHEQANCI